MDSIVNRKDIGALEQICQSLEQESGNGPWLLFVRKQATKLREVIGGEMTFRCNLCYKIQTGNELYKECKGYCKKCWNLPKWG